MTAPVGVTGRPREGERLPAMLAAAGLRRMRVAAAAMRIAVRLCAGVLAAAMRVAVTAAMATLACQGRRRRGGGEQQPDEDLAYMTLLSPRAPQLERAGLGADALVGAEPGVQRGFRGANGRIPLARAAEKG
jgi:hypothetical protein